MKILPLQNKELVAPLSSSEQFVNYAVSEMRLSRRICSVFDADPTFGFFSNSNASIIYRACLLKMYISVFQPF